MRLDPAFRYALYTAFAVLVATGIAWLIADQLKDTADGEGWQAWQGWQSWAAYALMMHGGAAMATLLLLGALFPLHVRRAWRAKRNRITGTGMVTFNAVLILTAFGLYYLGSDALRRLASDLHIAAGLALPVLALVHVVVGRRNS